MSSKTTKHENFKRMADARAQKLAKSLKVLSNLASYNYEFTADDVNRLFNFLSEQLATSRAKFDARLNKATTKANREAARDLGVTTGDDSGDDEEIDDERYPVIGEGDLGEDATPESPQTSLPGPTEYEIEHDNPHLPETEEPWGDDVEPAGPEMELADGGTHNKTHRKR